MLNSTYTNDNWLTRLIFWLKLTPGRIFAIWSILNLVVNILVAYGFGVLFPSSKNIGLFGDLIWVLHNCLIHPAILAYYCWLQTDSMKIFQILISEKVVDNNVKTKKLLKKYSGYFSNHIISVLILIISIFIVAVWYLSSFSMPQSNIQGYWITANPWIGIVVSPVLFVVAFALINMIYDCLVVVIALNDFFRNTPIRVNVLNPDRAGGLGVIGRFVANLSYFIALLGLTYSITLISYKSDFWTDYPVLIAVVAYIILAPFVFFAPLWTANLKMLEFRDNALRDLAQQFNISLLEFRTAKIKSHDDADLYIKNIKQIYELRELIMKFPAWPFNTSAFVKFFGLVYSTLIPGLISVVIGKL